MRHAARSFLARLRSAWSRRGLSAAGGPESLSAFLLRVFGGRPATTGATVNDDTTMSWTPISSGIRLIAETLASLPLNLYERQGRNKLLRPDLRLFDVLHNEPNPEMTSYEFRRMLQAHAILCGAGYAQIIRDGAMQVKELWPLSPYRVQMKRDAIDRLYYEITLPRDGRETTNGVRILPADEVLVIPGFSEYGLIGPRLATRFREAIGLGLAAEEFQGRFFGDGMSPSGVLTHPTTLSDEAGERLKKRVEDQVRGLDKAHSLLLLEEGTKWEQIATDPQKAQFFELRKFQVTEAARILRVPPHKLADLERATFTNIEHQGIEFAVDTMTPWVVCWEQRMHKSLLLEGSQKRNLAITFELKGLMRGDIKTRYDAYAIGRNWGWLSVNDIRALEDMNTVADGDVYLQPLNMTPAGTLPETATPPADDEAAARALVRLLRGLDVQRQLYAGTS